MSPLIDVEGFRRDIDAIRGRTVWLVGASSGIGAALAVEMTARGARVAVSARGAEALDEVVRTAGGDTVAVTVDVTDREGVHAAAESVRAALGEIDVVVWCAGYWGRFDSAAWDADSFARHIEVNLLGMNNVIDATLPQMVSNGRGHLVGIASVAGYRGLPGAEAYGPTKAAQINLLESLRASLSSHGIRVTTVCPGFVKTPMTADNDFPMPFIIDADEAATAIADGIERRRMEIVFPPAMALAMKTARLVPVRPWAALASLSGRR